MLLADPLTKLPGIGVKIAEKLHLLGLHNVQDLLFHLPLRYEDRTRIVSIAAAAPGEQAQICGRIIRVENRNTSKGSMLECTAEEKGTGIIFRTVFWHLYPNQIREFAAGKYIICFGLPISGPYGWSMSHPDYQLTSSIDQMVLPRFLLPVYPTTKGLRSEKIMQCTEAALQAAAEEGIEELLPPEAAGGITLLEALQFVHRVPGDYNWHLVRDGSSPHMRRIALEELTANTVAVRMARSRNNSHSAPSMPCRGTLRNALLSSLPFHPTAAQMRVTGEIDRDMEKQVPMLRLLQGDVGSGKTLVAALSTLNAAENNFQTAVMAPTEILAAQHHRKFAQLLEPLGITTVLLSGRLKPRERREALEKIASGEAVIAVGTHALFQDDVTFRDLGYIIIDEQHRFGVEQRLRLLTKGMSGNRIPHQLVMTATPIPRTLAMTSYADLDVSSIDEMPPGRKPIITRLIGSRARNKLIDRIRSVCRDQKWQVYWVCPLIEESERMDFAAAEEECRRLQEELPELKIGLIHGRLPGEDKQRIMQEFKDGSLDVLIATTVIEVGVDVPNATVIVIEDPQRLGLAQLHQLRGRVGRGQRQSYCMLYAASELSETARERLDFLSGCTDGLKIAEKDLELRGPGEYMGTRQTGSAGLRIAEFLRDSSLIPQANELARDIAEHRQEVAEKLISRWTSSDSTFTQT